MMVSIGLLLFFKQKICLHACMRMTLCSLRCTLLFDRWVATALTLSTAELRRVINTALITKAPGEQ